jgi:hypothetical protein
MAYIKIGMFAVIVIVSISFIAHPFSTLATNYTSDSTDFPINNSIKNLTSSILKIGPNPLANLSNPLANPLTNITE